MHFSQSLTSCISSKEQGDSAAAGIFKSAARELAKLVKGVYRNGNFDIPVYVSYSGGVFKAMKYIKETLDEQAYYCPAHHR